LVPLVPFVGVVIAILLVIIVWASRSPGLGPVFAFIALGGFLHLMRVF
jgi:hypothetical protein